MNPLKVLTISSVSVWLGAMAFFSIFVAPAAFSVLDRESAGRLVTTVFPRYYSFGAGLGVVALAGVLGQVLGRGSRAAPWATLALLLLMLGLTFYVMLVLEPQIQRTRLALSSAGIAPGSAAPEAHAFARLHRVSVILNGVTLLAGLALICVEAIRSRG